MLYCMKCSAVSSIDTQTSATGRSDDGTRGLGRPGPGSVPLSFRSCRCRVRVDGREQRMANGRMAPLHCIDTGTESLCRAAWIPTRRLGGHMDRASRSDGGEVLCCGCNVEELRMKGRKELGC